MGVWSALLLGALARAVHAPALLVLHFGWLSRAGEWTSLLARVGSAAVAAGACLLLARSLGEGRDGERHGSGGVRVALRIGAVVLLAIAFDTLARGLGAMTVVRLPAWYIEALSEMPTAAFFGSLPLVGQVIAAGGLAGAAWPIARGWRRWCLAFLVGFAMAFIALEVAVRAGLLDLLDSRGVVQSVFSYRLGMRVALDLFAAVALALQWHPERIARA